MNRPRIAAIIPAYNEEVTISKVVSCAKACALIDEVIVVSDGSTDHTATNAQKAGARVLVLPQTRGKAEALLFGVNQTVAEIFLFLDGDLIGLTQNHLQQLILPVLHGGRMMNIGIRDRGIFFTWLSHNLPLISGERALQRSVFEGVPLIYLHGFMIEVSLNYYCATHRLSSGVVDLHGLTIRKKYQKVPWGVAVVQYMMMSYHVIKAMILIRFAHLTGNF